MEYISTSTLTYEFDIKSSRLFDKLKTLVVLKENMTSGAEKFKALLAKKEASVLTKEKEQEIRNRSERSLRNIDLSEAETRRINRRTVKTCGLGS